MRSDVSYTLRSVEDYECHAVKLTEAKSASNVRAEEEQHEETSSILLVLCREVVICEDAGQSDNCNDGPVRDLHERCDKRREPEPLGSVSHLRLAVRLVAWLCLP